MTIQAKTSIKISITVGIMERLMNIKNNKRRRDSQIKIEKAFVALLQERELKQITVSDIIKETGLNRSTFYANYVDIFDLADKTRAKLEKDFSNLFSDYDYFNPRYRHFCYFALRYCCWQQEKDSSRNR
jgi:hypothetical protein